MFFASARLVDVMHARTHFPVRRCACELCERREQACSVIAPTVLSGLCDVREVMDVTSYLSGVISLSVDQFSSLQVHADTDRQCRVISGTKSWWSADCGGEWGSRVKALDFFEEEWY